MLSISTVEKIMLLDEDTCGKYEAGRPPEFGPSLLERVTLMDHPWRTLLYELLLEPVVQVFRLARDFVYSIYT